MKKVLVYGATGSQQGPVIGILKKKGMEVFATTHSEAKFDQLRGLGATPVIGNMADLDGLKKITEGMDGLSFVIPASLANPFDGLTYSKNIIDAAKAGQVKHIVWNTSGYFTPSKTGNPMSDVKLDVKEYLEKSGVPYTIIESNIYLENLLAPYTTDFVKNERKLAYPLPADMPVGWVATRDVAAMVVASLGNSAVAGKTIRVSGMNNLLGEELAQKISAGIGTELDYYALPPKDFGKIMSNLMDETSAKGIELHYQAIADSTPNYPQMFVSDMPSIIEQLGVRMTPLEEWANMHKSIFVG
jgi:uncharacterized protein YbjT (DUF2867 family)